MIFGDFSDNNALPLPLAGLDGAMLKLYPSGTRGGDWLLAAFAQCVRAFPMERVGFYAPGDVTPTWGEQKAAAAAIGVDLRDHPWALDLEFGYTNATIQSTMLAATMDGMKCRGLYQRASQQLGQTWDWRSIGGHVAGNTFPNMVLDQYVAKPFDHDRTDLSPEAWIRATISSWKEPPMAGEADAYFAKLEASGVRPSDWAGNVNRDLGNRYAARGVKPTKEQLANPDFALGYREGGGK